MARFYNLNISFSILHISSIFVSKEKKISDDLSSLEIIDYETFSFGFSLCSEIPPEILKDIYSFSTHHFLVT